MSEKQPLERPIEQLAKGTPHRLLIRTVLGWKQGKSIRLEVQQRVAERNCAPVALEMKCGFAGSGTVNGKGSNVARDWPGFINQD